MLVVQFQWTSLASLIYIPRKIYPNSSQQLARVKDSKAGRGKAGKRDVSYTNIMQVTIGDKAENRLATSAVRTTE